MSSSLEQTKLSVIYDSVSLRKFRQTARYRKNLKMLEDRLYQLRRRLEFARVLENSIELRDTGRI